MKKLIISIVVIGLLFSCETNKKGSMIVKGTIAGLKKGTVYLQKLNDTILVSVDSIQLNGDSNFILSDNLENPEIYFLALDKGTVNRIPFFGEKGEITITSKLSKFATSAKITGSKNQDLLNEHNAMAQKFNGKKLDLIVEKFDAQKANDTALVSKLNKEETGLIKRKYYYTTNFAVLNGEYEVAPYLALTELYNANIRLLDTINNSLSQRVKTSKYGLELEKFIQKIKTTEK